MFCTEIQTTQRWQTLSQLTRSGEQPDACHLLTEYLDLTQALSIGQNRTCQLQLYYIVYTDLLEAICDPLVSRHWRENCLNHLFQPILVLNRLACTEPLKQRVQQLDRQATQLSHYFLSR